MRSWARLGLCDVYFLQIDIFTTIDRIAIIATIDRTAIINTINRIAITTTITTTS